MNLEHASYLSILPYDENGETQFTLFDEAAAKEDTGMDDDDDIIPSDQFK
jgi:hypothetical protein